MKILAVGSATLPDPNLQSQVDHWRVYRPMVELARHVDWQIDHSTSFIPGFEKYQNKDEFTEEEMSKAFVELSQYDIVFSSYHPDPTAYTLLKVLRDRHNVQFVLDADDDMFAINPDNPFWMKMDDEKVYWMQRMIADNDWITTPSPVLAQRFRDRRPGLPASSVAVIPNYIADVYKHSKFDNGDTIVIGYMGGASHYADLHETGVLEAIRKLMHEHKNIRFKCIGMIVDEYIPKARFDFEPGKRGTAFFDEVFPNMKIDIAIAPLLDNLFNQGKSNIKWQEMTRAGATVVASNVGPYKSLLNGGNAKLVNNTSDDWYRALKRLIDKPRVRQDLLAAAQRDLRLNWRLENKWVEYRELFERVKREGTPNRGERATGIGTKKAPTILLPN